MILWRNNKSGKRYIWLAIAVDCTNCRDGSNVVVYRPEDDETVVYVRDAVEFQQKFTAEHV